MKIRKTSTLENPFTGQKIPMRTIFSIYAVFMMAIIARYVWKFFKLVRRGTPDELDGVKPFRGMGSDQDEH
jgi:C4-dicarboxylate transporter DctQ subunit